ncbi:MAG: hypothetical protein WCK65_14945 [Rhodospirillaceae bacterium]
MLIAQERHVDLSQLSNARVERRIGNGVGADTQRRLGAVGQDMYGIIATVGFGPFRDLGEAALATVNHLDLNARADTIG